MANTKIEWADKVWNPITGCSHAGSPGCDHCYAKRMAYRLKGRYGYPKDDPFKVTFHPDRLDEPLHWKKPCRIFVCSMGDLFHESVSSRFINSVIGIMTAEETRHHTFFILTKRPQNMAAYFKNFIKCGVDLVQFIERVYLGVSVENQQTADERIPILLQIPAAKRFVSVEPMLGPVDLGKLSDPNISWIIVGGETGAGARPLHLDWIRSLVEQCQAAGVPFFFKSWGEWEKSGHDSTHLLNADGRFVKRSEAMLRISDTRQDDLVDRGHLGWIRMKKVGKKRSGRLLDGKIWDEMPVCSKDFP